MSRKDYIAIANILSRWIVPMGLIGDLADYFAEENPRLNRERFIRVCLANERDRLRSESAVACWGKK